MSLRTDLVASYGSQLLAAALNVAVQPLWRDLLGAEAYGLVAVMAVVQIVFQLLELGMGPLLTREAARRRGGAIDAATMHATLRALEGIFVAIAVAGAAAMVLGASTLAGGWLRPDALPVQTVAQSIALIGGIAALRWMATLHRGVVVGFGELGWLGSVETAISLARFVVALPATAWLGGGVLAFLGWQLAVAAVEFALLRWRTRRLVPPVPGARTRWSLAPLRAQRAFMLSVGFTGAVWVGVTQIDKLVLMRVMSLDEFGRYTMATTLASVVTMLIAPLSEVVVPRLVRLASAGDETGLRALYRAGTRGLCVLVAPPVAMLALFAEPVLRIWTGDAALAASAAPVLALYALGNGCLAAAGFQYHLQVARGDLRLHVRGNVLFAATLVPLTAVAAWAWGGVGAGAVWFGTNLALVLAWVPRVHRVHAPGLHRDWLLGDVLRPLALALAAAAALAASVTLPGTRPAGAATLALLGVAVAAATAAGADLRGLRAAVRAALAQRVAA